MKILVIEDQPKVASFIVNGLQEERHVVDVSHDGEEGLRMAQTGTYDLILQDIMLPGINGFQAIETLRKGGIKTPIIALTARDTLEDRIRGLDCGADDYLAKPFEFSELLARIRAVSRRSGDVADPILKIDDLVIDQMSHTVSRSGKPIYLTPKEFALLDLLARHQGRVLTRTTILERVWEIHFDTETNLVDVFIRQLRSKIDGGHPVRLIQTVRGIGYVLRPERSA